MNEFEKLITDMENRREFHATVNVLVELLMDTNPTGVYKLDAPYLTIT